MKPTGPGSVGKPPHEGELRFGDVEAHAVRAEDANPGAGEPSDDLLLEVGHLGVAGLAEAGGEEVDASHALGDAVLDELRDDVRGDAGDDVVDGAVDVEDAGVALETLEFGVFRVHRVERGEAQLHEREEEAVPTPANPGCCFETPATATERGWKIWSRVAAVGFVSAAVMSIGC